MYNHLFDHLVIISVKKCNIWLQFFNDTKGTEPDIYMNVTARSLCGIPLRLRETSLLHAKQSSIYWMWFKNSWIHLAPKLFSITTFQRPSCQQIWKGGQRALLEEYKKRWGKKIPLSNHLPPSPYQRLFLISSPTPWKS